MRSFDRTLPEEINRVLTDQISDLLFTTESTAEENLLKEGIDSEKIFFVGNIMIDTLLQYAGQAKESGILDELGLYPNEYAVLTLHRPSNVDSKDTLLNILLALREIQKEIPILFPIHPRTQRLLIEFGLSTLVKEIPALIITECLGYLDFLKAMSNAKFVMTDSGGIQEETTVLGIPCLTLRDNTERPVTVTHGTNLVVGNDSKRIVHESMKLLNGHIKKAQQPDLWDGKAAQRIVDVLSRYDDGGAA